MGQAGLEATDYKAGFPELHQCGASSVFLGPLKNSGQSVTTPLGGKGQLPSGIMLEWRGIQIPSQHPD